MRLFGLGVSLVLTNIRRCWVAAIRGEMASVGRDMATARILLAKVESTRGTKPRK